MIISLQSLLVNRSGEIFICFAHCLTKRGHPCCLRKIVGQRRKPLQNDADKRYLLHSKKGFVCSPAPPSHWPPSDLDWQGKSPPATLSLQAASLRSAAGNFLAVARKSGEPPTRVPPRRNRSLNGLLLPFLRFAYAFKKSTLDRVLFLGISRSAERDQRALPFGNLPTFCKRLDRKLYYISKYNYPSKSLRTAFTSFLESADVPQSVR